MPTQQRQDTPLGVDDDADHDDQTHRRRTTNHEPIPAAPVARLDDKSRDTWATGTSHDSDRPPMTDAPRRDPTTRQYRRARRDRRNPGRGREWRAV